MSWKIVIPEDTVNYITNPSTEQDTSGWTGYDGSIAKSSVQQAYGGQSVKYSSNGTGPASVLWSFTPDASTQYCWSIWLWRPAVADWTGGNLSLSITSTGRTINTAPVVVTQTEEWIRIFVVFTTGASPGTSYLEIFSASTPSAGKFFYFDGAQLEKKGYCTDYCDGDQPGCRWDGAFWASVSSRDSRDYPAGREYDLADDFDFHVSVPSGTGVAPIKNQSFELALQPGGLATGQKIKSRVFSLKGTITGSTPADFHSKKQSLIRALLSMNEFGLGTPGQRILRYKDLAAVDKEILVVYDGGLEGGLPLGWTEADFDVRFRADDPFFYDVLQEGSLLDTRDLTNTYGVIAKLDGDWDSSVQPDSAGDYQEVNQVRTYNGEVYICGKFLNWDNQANLDYLAKWDGDSWVQVGNQVLNNEVRAMEFNTDGNLFIGGYFTGLNGVANYLAEWDGTAWDNVGSGGSDNPNGDVYALDILPNNDVIIGGVFTDVAAISNTLRIARFDGTSWNAMGTGAVGPPYHLDHDNLGNVYVVGNFASIGGVSKTACVAKWDGSAWKSLGGGVNTTADGILVARDNSIYISGDFTLDGAGNTITRFARFTGSSWEEVGGGINGRAYWIYEQKDGTIIICGAFTLVGVNTTEQIISHLAAWSGGRWSEVDWNPTGTMSLRGGFAEINRDQWFFFKGTGWLPHSGYADLKYSGTAPAYPVFILRRIAAGAGTEVRWIENILTGAKLIFNKYNLELGETLIVDTRPGYQKVWSSFNGNVWYALHPGSDLADIFLVPGVSADTPYTNRYRVYVTNSSTSAVVATMWYRPAYYSED